MSKMATYKQILIELKQKLEKGEMSTLVGAGFSKNIDLSFPDWAELIHQMVLFSEGKRLEKDFSNRFPKVKLNDKRYLDYLKKEVRAFIEQVGPLKAVSDYIKIKGFRESADFLIEQKTPVIEVIKGKRHLRSIVDGKIKRRLLSDADIACHTKLVNLPWNNIFTTNYDNLLETCIDINSKEEVEKEIAGLEKKIVQRKVTEKKLSEKVIKLSIELENRKVERSVTERAFGIKSTEAQHLKEKIAIIESSIQEHEGNIRYESHFLEYHFTRLENLNDIQKNFRTTVVHSSELAIKKNQNIIKIHGSIRKDSSERFGFDGDVSKNYVISQQDYDSYGMKHEAFMQLMRITLLQESFCLFGFSGIDPNFLGWISWVRDVLQKNPTGGGSSDKIYMIDVWPQEAEPAKALFYRNHQIAFIPLGNPACIGFLEEATGKKIADDSPKARINLLLEYLSVDIVPGAEKIGFEVLKQSEYQGIWDTLPTFRMEGSKLDSFLKKADQILALKTYNRLPLLSGINDVSQQNFLIRFSDWYAQVKDNRKSVVNLLRLSLLMLNEVYLPVSLLFGDDIDEFRTMQTLSKDFSELSEHFSLVSLKDAVWANDSTKVESLVEELQDSANPEILQELHYQKALFAFYNFNFESLKHVLSTWAPLGHWAMKKSGLQSQMSITGAIESLRAIEQTTVQETAYRYHILSYLYASNGLRKTGEKQYKIVRAIEKGNLKSFDHTIKRLLSKLEAKTEKLSPYGAEKFTITTSISFGGSSSHRAGLQLLSLFLETGHPLRLTYIRNLSGDEVYKLLELAVSWYPEVVLFFAFQFPEEKFLTRIAQDLIYENAIQEKIPLIARKLMEAYSSEHTPPKYKSNILVAMSEFINVLDPAEWQPFYLKVWTLEIKDGFLIDDIRKRENNFLTKGIALLTDPMAAEKIIEILLLQFIATTEQQVKDNVIHFLFQFSNNAYLNELVKGTGMKISAKIFDKLILRLKDDVFFLFVLGNISFSFSQQQVDKVKSTLAEINAFNNTNSRLWRVILFFGDGDAGIETKVKEAILNSDGLWRSGIDLSVSKYTAYRDAIKLSALRQYRKGRNLQWTEHEIKVLYNRMTEELDKVYQWQKNFDYPTEFRDLIKEMKIFISTEEYSISGEPSFQEVKRKVAELQHLERQGEDNLEAVLGGDKSTIIIEIENASEDIYNKNNLEKNFSLIETLLYKLLLQKEPALPAALTAIANWFYYKRSETSLKEFKRLLELVLQTYQKNIGFDIDGPSLEEYLLKIALVLREWGTANHLTQDVLKLLETSRYNSIKYNLRAELNLI